MNWYLILFALWSIVCVAAGVLLSRRLIITTTDLYGTMYHDARMAKAELAVLEAKIKAKGQDVSKIIKG